MILHNAPKKYAIWKDPLERDERGQRAIDVVKGGVVDDKSILHPRGKECPGNYHVREEA